MASIRTETTIDASPDAVWEALRAWGEPHLRLVPGFVTDTRLDGADRIVTFFNGVTVREVLVTLDDTARRLVWSVVDGPYSHHNGAAQVLLDADGHDALRLDRGPAPRRGRRAHEGDDGAGHRDGPADAGVSGPPGRLTPRGRSSTVRTEYVASPSGASASSAIDGSPSRSISVCRSVSAWTMPLREPVGSCPTPSTRARSLMPATVARRRA